MANTKIPQLMVHHLSFTPLQLLANQNKLGSQYLNGVQVIGGAYDPFDAYASSGSVYYQIFDWAKVPKKPVPFKKGAFVPEPVEVDHNPDVFYDKFHGATIGDFQKDLSTKINIKGATNFFSDTISNHFSTSTLFRPSNEYCRVQQTFKAWSLLLNPGPHLRQYLYPKFLKTIDEAKTAEKIKNLFTNYSSHFLTGALMGGCAYACSATNKILVDKANPVLSTAVSNFQMLTGQLNSKENKKYGRAIQDFKEVSELNYYVKGGDPSVAAAVFSGDIKPFDTWKKTTPDFTDLVDFPNKNSLAGMWELCDDTGQKKEMEEYFLNEWAGPMVLIHTYQPNYIDDITVIEGRSADIEAPIGYTKIDCDLNAGAGGKYIYFCYHTVGFDTTGNNVDCIKDILFISGKDAKAPDGYIKVDADLNAGARGRSIYLCFKKGVYDPVDSIKGLEVVGGSPKKINVPYDFTKIDQDLNAGAGGEYIYLCYSKLS